MRILFVAAIAALIGPFSGGCSGGSEENLGTTWQEIVGECTSTNQCKSMYDGATDCKNGEGGVCYCGNVPCDSVAGDGNGSDSDRTNLGDALRLENKGHGMWLQATAAEDSSATNNGVCGDDSAKNVRANGTTNTGDWTRWTLEPTSGGYFHIQSVASGSYLQATDLPDATGKFNAVRLVEASCGGNWTQWEKVTTGDGYFHLRNRQHGTFLQTDSGADVDTGEGLQVRAADPNKTGDWTRWKEVAAGSDGGGDSPGTPSDPGNPANYSGRTHWNASTGTLTFTSNGQLPNTHHGWTVPNQVKKIVIGAGVRVTGRFDVFHSMTIEGQNRATSEIFGTPQTGYNKNNDGCGLCKSAVYGEGNITVTVKNLTSRNPFGFHFTGKQGAKLVIDSVDAIDDRGGHGNNSDGVSAANGTIVRNSYFETGDDVIKVYSDITVENTTIRMVQNTVPIQLGWGNYGSGAKGTFRNLTVIGDGGRGQADRAMISARQGNYNKTIDIDGLRLENPNGVVMIFREASGHADITIKNALIDVEKFRGSQWSMDVDPKVCGTVYQNGQGAPSFFDCR